VLLPITAVNDVGAVNRFVTDAPDWLIAPESAPDLAGFVADALQQLGQTGGLARLRERWHL